MTRKVLSGIRRGVHIVLFGLVVVCAFLIAVCYVAMLILVDTISDLRGGDERREI